MWDILGLGSVTVDDFYVVPYFPIPDTKLEILSTERQGGGLTATALVAATRLGATCAYGGVLGHDDISKWVEADLAREGIDVSRMARRDNAQPIHSHVIVEQQNHTRTILYTLKGQVGADDELPSEVDIRASKILFIDDFGVTGNFRAATIARAAGVPVVADFEHMQSVPLLGLVDHLIVSIRYASAVTRINQPEAAAQSLWKPQSKLVAVTCGEAGCYYTTDGQTVAYQPAFKVEAVDTTGCGDVFHGAYAAALVWGWSAGNCIRFAAASAALKATQAGGRRGIPNRAQVEVFLQERR